MSILSRVREAVETAAIQRRADTAFARVQETIASQLQQELAEEDTGWRKLNDGAGSYDLTPTELRDVREKCIKAWQIDPSLGTAGALLASGAFGTGEIRPRAVDTRVQSVVDRLWDDEDNRLALFSRQAMVRTSNALLVDGERFIGIHASTTESRVKLSELPCSEVVDVVAHPENALRPVLYRRTYRPQVYDLAKGQYQPGPEQTVYYADWRCWRYILDPTFGDDDEDWDPAIADLLSRAGILDDPTPVLCYHIRTNTLGQRGIPEAYRAYDWIRSHSRTLSAMVTLAKALSMFAWRKKLNTKSATAIQAAAQAFRNPVPGTGAVQVENQNVQLDAVDVGTGGVGNLEAAGRQTHLQSIRPFGFGEQWYSDASTGNLATATAMEMPAIWRIEARQTDVGEPCLDITGLAVALAIIRQDYPTRRLPQGVDRKVDLDFPAAQPPNPANTAQLLGALTAASGTLLDPQEAAYQGYMAIGSNNVQEILERQFPAQEKLDGEAATTDEPEPGQPTPDETPAGEQDAEQVAERAQEAVRPFEPGEARRRLEARFAAALQSRVIEPWHRRCWAWVRRLKEAPSAKALTGAIRASCMPNQAALADILRRYILEAADAGGQDALDRARPVILEALRKSGLRVAEALPVPVSPPSSASALWRAIEDEWFAAGGPGETRRGAIPLHEDMRSTVQELLSRGEGWNATDGFTFHLRDPALQRELLRRGEKIRGQVTDTMLQDFRDVMAQQFYREGLPPDQLALEIEKLFPTTYKDRALTIARTETAIAYGVTNHETMSYNGVDGHEWHSFGRNPREAHIAASGQTQPINEPFRVGGERLMHPGDPSGSPGNIINCHCDELPVVINPGGVPAVPWTGQPLKDYVAEIVNALQANAAKPSAGPVGAWTPAETIEEAQAWAASRGVTFSRKLPTGELQQAAKAKYGFTVPREAATLDDLNAVNESIAQLESTLSPYMRERLAEQPIEVVFVRSKARIGGLALATPDETTIYYDMKQIRLQTRYAPPAGEYADASVPGVTRHELSHVLHKRDRLADDLAYETKLFAQDWRPSQYGEVSFEEHYAEWITLITKPGFDIKSLPREMRPIARKFLR